MAKKNLEIKPIEKVLIANRGEIAVRITKTLQAMGISVVAVYSDPDANAQHTLMANEAIDLEGVSPTDTYLNIEKLISAAQRSGADAIHPGYGFLSERAPFAKACAQAGITFIGPSEKVIEQMGDKLVSKTVMKEAGVPVVPSWSGSLSDEKAVKKAVKELGYPLLIKAAAGGGGKGMRLVHSDDELEPNMAAAQREAKYAFGDDRVFLERYITKPRHVEFQVFGDSHGNVVHVYERDCSIQRRHQKIIEESPSPQLPEAVRQKMGEVAVQAAKAVNYTNAGTVEFIVGEDNEFYFLEMNTRLQVEHPVTELVTGLDLVEWQIRVAQGEALPLAQADISQSGHALECRLYAEDPCNQFLPSTGPLLVYDEPVGPGIRVDSGVCQDDVVSVHFDPMLSKLITYAPTRQLAIDKMIWALRHYPMLGVTTNHALLLAILRHPDFIEGKVDTHFLQKYSPESLLENANCPHAGVIAKRGAAVLSSNQGRRVHSSQGGAASSLSSLSSPWMEVGRWQMV